MERRARLSCAGAAALAGVAVLAAALACVTAAARGAAAAQFVADCGVDVADGVRLDFSLLGARRDSYVGHDDTGATYAATVCAPRVQGRGACHSGAAAQRGVPSLCLEGDAAGQGRNDTVLAYASDVRLPDFWIFSSSGSEQGPSRAAFNGDPCQAGAAGEKPRTGVMFFVCDPTEDGARLTNVTKVAACAYKAVVATKYACPQHATAGDRPVACGMSHGNVTYDLSPLAALGPLTLPGDDFSYAVTVCDRVAGACDAPGGVASFCQFEGGPARALQGREPLAVVAYETRSPGPGAPAWEVSENGFAVLNASNGEACGGQPRQSALTMVCDEENREFGGMNVSLPPGCYPVTGLFYTKYACPTPHQVQAVVHHAGVGGPAGLGGKCPGGPARTDRTVGDGRCFSFGGGTGSGVARCDGSGSDAPWSFEYYSDSDSCAGVPGSYVLGQGPGQCVEAAPGVVVGVDCRGPTRLPVRFAIFADDACAVNQTAHGGDAAGSCVLLADGKHATFECERPEPDSPWTMREYDGTSCGGRPTRVVSGAGQDCSSGVQVGCDGAPPEHANVASFPVSVTRFAGGNCSGGGGGGGGGPEQHQWPDLSNGDCFDAHGAGQYARVVCESASHDSYWEVHTYASGEFTCKGPGQTTVSGSGTGCASGLAVRCGSAGGTHRSSSGGGPSAATIAGVAIAVAAFVAVLGAGVYYSRSKATVHESRPDADAGADHPDADAGADHPYTSL